MTELSLNERLAIAFGGKPDIYDDDYPPDDYENDNVAAFALLEKAKQDGKIFNYVIRSDAGRTYCAINKKNNNEEPLQGFDHSPSKAITQALAQLLK